MNKLIVLFALLLAACTPANKLEHLNFVMTACEQHGSVQYWTVGMSLGYDYLSVKCKDGTKVEQRIVTKK